MKIKSKLVAAAVLPFVMFVFMAAAVYSISLDVENNHGKEEIGAQVSRMTSDLIALTYEYGIIAGERPRLQWLEQYSVIETTLASARLIFVKPEEKALVEEMARSFVNTQKGFSGLCEKDAEGKRDSISLQVRTNALNNIVLDLHALEALTNKLYLIGHSELKSTIGRANIIYMVMFAAFIILVSPFLIVIVRRISSPIERLHNAMRAVASGDLQYRLPVESKDEIGDLTAGFNEMAEKIKGFTVSRDELISEIEMRKNTEKALRAAGAYNRSLIESSLDPLVTIGADGTITDLNSATEKATGYSREELIGTDFSRYFSDPDKAEEGYLRVFREGFVRDYELEIRHSSGGVTPVVYNASVFRDEEGSVAGVFAAARDISELRKVEERLEEQRSFMEKVLESLTHPFYVVDASDYKIVMANLASGIRDSSGSVTCYELTHRLDEPCGGGDHVCPLDEVKKTKRSFKAEHIHFDAAGNMRTFEVNAYPLFDDDGNVIRIIEYGLDITDRKAAEEELEKYRQHLETIVEDRTKSLEEKSGELNESQSALMNIVEDLNQKTVEIEQANLKLKDLDRMKSMFIASMSHELRTPLNSIIGFTSIILDEWVGPINDEQKKNLATVLRSGKHLLSLINDVIDVSKIEAGKFESTVEDFDLYDVLAEAEALIKNEAVEKGLELEVVAVHRQMRTDRRRLYQCVVNLLGNAVKFTEKGGVKVTAAEAPDEPGFVFIEVSDTGIGIREADIGKLFVAFVRLPSHLSAKVKGTGLGLYLVRKIAVEILKGDVSAKSEYEKGSSFCLKIPVKL